MANNVNIELEEYNAFGPWAYEISERYPLPRLFAPFFTDDDNAVIKIKVPREIDRRNAEPGMNFYDYVIALYEDRLLILERRDESVKEYSVALKDIMGVRIYKNMLMGGYTIYSGEGAVSFPFNAVSLDLFRKFTNLLLEKVKSKDTAGSKYDTASLPVSDTNVHSTLLNNMLHDLQMEMPDIRLGAVQKGEDVQHKAGTQTMLERLLWKEMNPEALHLYTDEYLIILENGIFPNRIGIEDFGHTQTIIPLNRIGGIEIIDAEGYEMLKECILSVGPNKISYHFGANNTEMTVFYNALK